MSDQPSKRFEMIYELVRRIPRGKVTTYGVIAKKLGMYPRLVGYALHLNPDGEKTPCHRVVNRDGRIAKGFAFGGENEQRKRLEQEGIIFVSKDCVDFGKYLFNF